MYADTDSDAVADAGKDYERDRSIHNRPKPTTTALLTKTVGLLTAWALTLAGAMTKDRARARHRPAITHATTPLANGHTRAFVPIRALIIRT